MPDEFTTAYIGAALATSNDEKDGTGGQPLDRNYSLADIAPEALAKITCDCERFQASPILENEEPGKLPMAVHAFRLNRLARMRSLSQAQYKTARAILIGWEPDLPALEGYQASRQ